MSTIILILVIYALLSGAGLLGILNPDEDKIILAGTLSFLLGWFFFPMLVMFFIGRMINRYL